MLDISTLLIINVFLIIDSLRKKKMWKHTQTKV